jgi:hypothetical protein
VDGRIAVSIQIKNNAGALVAEMERNEWKVAPGPSWDKNFNDTALEVKDSSGDVVLQVDLLPDRIRLQALWYDEHGWLWGIVKEPKQGGSQILIALRSPAPEFKITPMFRYPADRHPGELISKRLSPPRT